MDYRNYYPEHYHFQLTPRCNLHCRFCGQDRGMRASGADELPLEFWQSLAEEAAQLCPDGVRPEITLWGGEPLLYQHFDQLAQWLHQQGKYELAIVTNGTLAARHEETLCGCFDTIFVSIDGNREMTDSVRGEGTYDALEANLPKLAHRRGKLVLMAVVSDANVSQMAQIPAMLAPFNPDKVILSQLMYLSPGEVTEYQRESQERFGCTYPQLECWERTDDREYLRLLQEGQKQLQATEYPFPVEFTGHYYPHGITGAHGSHCQAPWSRLHIRNDGACGFCTDYFGFQAGNACRQSLKEIFHSSAAEEFRRAVQEDRLPICRHCPWRRQRLCSAGGAVNQ